MNDNASAGPVQNAFDDAVTETFETMAFMEIRRADGDANPEPDGTWHYTAVGLVTPVTGKVVIVCSEDILSEIADTLFGGIDFPPEAEPTADALAEITNIVAGGVLARLAPENVAIKVGLPESGQGEYPHEVVYLTYELDDGRTFLVGYDISNVMM